MADNPKVIIVIGDATETVDTLYPYLRVQEEGFQPVVAGPQKRRFHMVLHESPENGWEITREFEGYTLQADVAFEEIDPAEYIGLFCSGGRAPEYIRYNEHLVAIVRYFMEHNKPVASVCHGVEIPAYAGVVKGRTMACVPKCRFDLGCAAGSTVKRSGPWTAISSAVARGATTRNT
jgi:protease I